MVLCPSDVTPCWKATMATTMTTTETHNSPPMQPFGAVAAIEHRLNVPFWSGIAAGAAQAQYWLLRLWQRHGGQCVISAAHW